MSSQKKHNGTVIAVSLCLMFLVPLLAYLQYFWLGEVSEREYERMQANLRMAAFHFSIDFDRELISVVQALGSELKGPESAVCAEMQGRLTSWFNTSSSVSVIGPVYYIVPKEAGGKFLIKVLDLQEGHFSDATPPVESESWTTSFGDSRFWSRVVMRPEAPVFILKNLRGMAIPVSQEGKAGNLVGIRPFIVVTFKWDYISGVLIPALAASHLQSAGENVYDIVITDQGNPPKIIYSSSGMDETGVSLDRPDAVVPIANFPPEDPIVALRPPWSREEFARRLDRAPSERRRAPGGDFPDPGIRPLRPPVHILRVFRRPGSLEAVVQRNRIRNLAISFGILLLLAGSIFLLLMSTHRSQRLARRQIESVAGVSHELRTPLTVLKSLGENLADGVVTDQPRVREYGEMVGRETSKLTDIIDNVLEYARIGSGRTHHDLKMTDPLVILHGALNACAGIIRKYDVAVEIDVVSTYPPIMADAPSLQRALQNILNNAVKYGHDGRILNVSMYTASSADELILAIQDHGIGIYPEDLTAVFTPFFRGRNAVDSRIEGSGLGLSLARQIIEAHGGQITVESTPGTGSIFNIRLPLKQGANNGARESERS